MVNTCKSAVKLKIITVELRVSFTLLRVYFGTLSICLHLRNPCFVR